MRSPELQVQPVAGEGFLDLQGGGVRGLIRGFFDFDFGHFFRVEVHFVVDVVEERLDVFLLSLYESGLFSFLTEVQVPGDVVFLSELLQFLPALLESMDRGCGESDSVRFCFFMAFCVWRLAFSV